MAKSEYDIDPVVIPEQVPAEQDLTRLRIGDTYINSTNGFVVRNREVDGDYIAQAQDVSIIANSTTTITIHVDINVPFGKQLWISNLTANTATIQGSASYPINGNTQYLLTSQYDSVLLQMTTDGWLVMATK